MKLKAEIVKTSYRVEVDEEKFFNLINNEKIDESLFKTIEKLYGHSIDWNGHFGSAIYFSLDTEDKNNLPKILKEIEQHLKQL